MKTRNDCEIACDRVKRANLVLHVGLYNEIFARKHTATHKPTSAQSLTVTTMTSNKIASRRGAQQASYKRLGGIGIKKGGSGIKKGGVANSIDAFCDVRLRSGSRRQNPTYALSGQSNRVKFLSLGTSWRQKKELD